MKKQILVIILLAVLVLSCLALTACHSCEFGEWMVAKQPTCTQDGSKERVCECGEIETEIVSATGHTFGEWTVIDQANCVEAGLKVQVCECGEGKNEIIPATGHSREALVTAPTCTTQGYTTLTCSVCGDSYVDTDTFTSINKNNHSDSNNDGLCDNCQGVLLKFTGEYAYDNAWTPGAKYGVRVEVTVNGDIITNVKITSTNTNYYTNVSLSWADKARWENSQADFLASFVGKTVAEVKAIVVNCMDNGTPQSITGFTVVAGASQSSGRLILAIQDALSKIDA